MSFAVHRGMEVVLAAVLALAPFVLALSDPASVVSWAAALGLGALAVAADPEAARMSYAAHAAMDRGALAVLLAAGAVFLIAGQPSATLVLAAVAAVLGAVTLSTRFSRS